MDTQITAELVLERRFPGRAGWCGGTAARAGARLAAALRALALSRPGTVVTATVLPATLLALWHAAAERAWVSPLILPPPALVLRTLRELWGDGTIQANLAVSAARVARGFGLGATAGLALGTALGLSRTFRAYVEPTVLAVTQVNVVSWIPLLILVVGIDEPLKTAAIAYASVLPITLNTAKGIAGIPGGWLELARVHQLRRHEVLWKVAVPAALPSIFTGLRSGLAAAWMSLVVVELVASSEGVGFMVVWGRQLFQLDVVMAAIVVVAAVGLALDVVLRAGERRLRVRHGGAR